MEYVLRHSLYRSPNIVRVITSRRSRWAGHVGRREDGRSVFNIFTGRKPLRRSRRRWEDSIKEIGINVRNFVDSAQDRDNWRAHLNAALTTGFHKPWS